MCLLFELPTGAGGLASSMASARIFNKIKEFSSKHAIEYKTLVQGYKFKVWFQDPQYYTLFLLVYEPDKPWRKPVVVDEPYS